MSPDPVRGRSSPVNVVSFSGGIGSWATAKRVVMGAGIDRTLLLFADTLAEDADTYRFLIAGAANIGRTHADHLTARTADLPPMTDLPARKAFLSELRKDVMEYLPWLHWVADGRTPFEVYRDRRFLGNNRITPCSKHLKVLPCREWVEARCDPGSTIIHVGIDWTEIARMRDIVEGWKPFEARAPMCDRPYLDKPQMIAWARAERLRPPQAYATGYPHSNCLDQGCVRGGQAYWKLLMRDRPDAYAYSEASELDLRDYLDANVAILRDRRGLNLAAGDKPKPWTLRDFRAETEQVIGLFDPDDWGGCGCDAWTDATPIDIALEAAA